jgi:hypothetical protein
MVLKLTGEKVLGTTALPDDDEHLVWQLRKDIHSTRLQVTLKVVRHYAPVVRIVRLVHAGAGCVFCPGIEVSRALSSATSEGVKIPVG